MTLRRIRRKVSRALLIAVFAMLATVAALETLHGLALPIMLAGAVAAGALADRWYLRHWAARRGSRRSRSRQARARKAQSRARP
jgi:L-lactate permease